MNRLNEKKLNSLVKKVLKEFEGNPKGNIILSPNISPEFKDKIDTSKISTTGTVPICTSESEGCAQFVNDYSDKIGFVGDAWLAHNNDGLGTRIYSAFTKLTPEQIKKVVDLWIKIHNKGGGVKGGKLNGEVRDFVNTIVPKKPNVTLKVDDIVGIFYPPSPNHELAFYSAGKSYFVPGKKMSKNKDVRKGEGKDPYVYKLENEKIYYSLKNDFDKKIKKFRWKEATNPKAVDAIKSKIFSDVSVGGSMVPGNTIKSGKGWGMNTHVGIVGAIKNGVPIIFHNIHGQVFSEPYDKLSDGARIAWVRRPNSPITEGKKKRLIEIGLDGGNEFIAGGRHTQEFKTAMKKKSNTDLNKLSCVPKEFRSVVNELLIKGYNKTFLKVALSVIGRESSFASGLRYNITAPLKAVASWIGFDTSVGPGQMKTTTADELKVKESLLTIKGALIAVYKYLKRSYDMAQKVGYSTNQTSINFNEGTGNAALDLAIASYNIGIGKVQKYCNKVGTETKNSKTPKVPCDSVNNKQVQNYLPNYKTKRYDGVNISTHGYVKEVASYFKKFTCF
jgi:hypothetical protein